MVNSTDPKLVYELCQGLYSSIRSFASEIPFADQIMGFVESIYNMYQGKKKTDQIVSHAMLLCQDLLLMCEGYYRCLKSFPDMPNKKKCLEQMEKIEACLEELKEVWEKYADRGFFGKMWCAEKDAKRIADNEAKLKEVTLIVIGSVNADINQAQNEKLFEEARKIEQIEKTLKEMPTYMQMEAAIRDLVDKNKGESLKEIEKIKKIALAAQLNRDDLEEELEAKLDRDEFQKELDKIRNEMDMAVMNAYQGEFFERMKTVKAEQEVIQDKMDQINKDLQEIREDIDDLKAENKRLKADYKEMEKNVDYLMKKERKRVEHQDERMELMKRILKLELEKQERKCEEYEKKYAELQERDEKKYAELEAIILEMKNKNRTKAEVDDLEKITAHMKKRDIATKEKLLKMLDPRGSAFVQMMMNLNKKGSKTEIVKGFMGKFLPTDIGGKIGAFASKGYKIVMVNNSGESRQFAIQRGITGSDDYSTFEDGERDAWNRKPGSYKVWVDKDKTIQVEHKNETTSIIVCKDAYIVSVNDNVVKRGPL